MNERSLNIAMINSAKKIQMAKPKVLRKPKINETSYNTPTPWLTQIHLRKFHKHDFLKDSNSSLNKSYETEIRSLT